MPREIVMPQMGMVQTEGTVVEWLRAEGDQVASGDVVAQVETDKATVEVEAPCDGTIVSLAPVGEPLPVGHRIGLVVEADEPAPSGVPTAPASPAPPSPPLPAAAPTAPAPAVSPPAASPSAAPAARRLAAELGVSLTDVPATGPGGRIVERDVRRFAEAGQGEAAEAPWTDIRVTGVRLTMAQRMQASGREIPHFWLRREVDAAPLLVQRRPGATKLSRPVDDWILDACVAALRRHPGVNATWRDGVIRRFARVNVGVAVSTGRGLVVPVIRDADRLTPAERAGVRLRLVERAKAGQLGPDELSDATFTVTNVGALGADTGWPLVSPGQAAILCVGRARWVAGVADGHVVPAFVVELLLGADHRVIDGAEGGALLHAIAEALGRQP